MLNIIIPLQLNVKLVQLDAPLVLQVMSVQYAIRPKDMPFQVPLVLFAHQLNSSTSAQKPVRRVRDTNRVSPPVFPVHLTAITAMQTGALNVKLVLILILPTSASNVLLHSFSIKHPKLANHVAMLNIIIPLQLNVKLVQLVALLVLQVMSAHYAIRLMDMPFQIPLVLFAHQLNSSTSPQKPVRRVRGTKRMSPPVLPVHLTAIPAMQTGALNVKLVLILMLPTTVSNVLLHSFSMNHPKLANHVAMLNIIIPLQLYVKLVQLDAPLVLQVMSAHYAIRLMDMPFQIPLVLFVHQLNSSTSPQKPVRRVRGTKRMSPPVLPVHLTAIPAMQTGALNVKLVLILMLPTTVSNVLLHSFSMNHPKLANHVAMLNIIIPLQLYVKLVQLDAPLVLQVMSAHYAIRLMDMPFQIPLVLFAHQLNSSTSPQKPVRRVRGTKRMSPPVLPVHLTAIPAMQTGALNVKLVLILMLPTTVSNVLLHSFSMNHPKLANHVAMLNIIIPLQLYVKLVQLDAPLVLQVHYAIRLGYALSNTSCLFAMLNSCLFGVQKECHLLPVHLTAIPAMQMGALNVKLVLILMLPTTVSNVLLHSVFCGNQLNSSTSTKRMSPPVLPVHLTAITAMQTGALNVKLVLIL